MAKQIVLLVSAEAKTRVCKEFGEAIENDFQLVSVIFCPTIQINVKGKQDQTLVVLELRELLTLIMRWWNDPFEDDLNSTRLWVRLVHQLCRFLKYVLLQHLEAHFQ